MIKTKENHHAATTTRHRKPHYRASRHRRSVGYRTLQVAEVGAIRGEGPLGSMTALICQGGSCALNRNHRGIHMIFLAPLLPLAVEVLTVTVVTAATLLLRDEL